MASGASVLLALAVAGAGAVSAAGAILVIALGLGLYARHWLSLAERSRVGARSEDEVRRPCASAEGWRLRHSLPWRGRGDIDSLAIAPNGLTFVVETKTRTYDDRHLARVRERAAWLSRRRRRWCWCRRGAVPVVCVVRARGVQRLEQNVLVVSIDRLIPMLQRSVSELGMGGLFDERDPLE